MLIPFHHKTAIMKRNLILMSFLVITFLIVQSSDSIYRAVYNLEEIYTFVDDTLDFKTRKDILHLELLPNRSFCYSKHTWFTDSLKKQPDGEKIWMMLFQAAYNSSNRDPSQEPSYPHKRNTFQISKSHQDSNMRVIDYFNEQYYEYQEAMPNYKWNITDSIKQINGFTCISAECHVYGRDWTVWFCPELPWADGPWKFSGLPGLVVAAYDSNCYYKFELSKIYPITNPVMPWVNKPKRTNRVKFNKQRYDYLQKIDSNLNAEFGIKINYTKKSLKRYRIGIESDYPHK